MNHVIMANHMISLITSSTTDPSWSINVKLMVVIITVFNCVVMIKTHAFF